MLPHTREWTASSVCTATPIPHGLNHEKVIESYIVQKDRLGELGSLVPCGTAFGNVL